MIMYGILSTAEQNGTDGLMDKKSVVVSFKNVVANDGQLLL